MRENSSYLLMIIFSVSFLLLTPLISFGELYISGVVPTDDIIIKRASDLEHCDKGIKNIVGKFQRGDNLWEVFYEYSGTGGKTVWNNDMSLKRLDTGIWILECGGGPPLRAHYSFGGINK